MEKKQMKDFKKFIPLIIAIVAILVIVLTVVIVKINSGKKYEPEKIVYNYLLLNNDGKYGIINNQGNEILKAEYDLVQLPNPEYPIFICYTNNTNNNKTTKVVNESGEQLYTDLGNVFGIETRDTVSPWTLLTGYVKYEIDGKYGLATVKGKKITDAKYDSVEALAYKNDALLVCKDGKYGVINFDGKEIIKPEYDNITADRYYNDENKYEYTGYIVTTKTDDGYRYGYVNYKGKVVLKPEYNEINRIVEIEGKTPYLIVKKEASYGMMKNKKMVIDFQYQSLNYDSTSLLVSAQKDDKTGVLDLKGNVIVPIEYTTIEFSGIYISAQNSEGITRFNSDGSKVNENEKFISKMPTQDNRYFVVVNEQEKFGILSANNSTVINNDYDYIDYAYGNYFIASKEGKVGVIDVSGKVILEFKYDAIQKVDNAEVLEGMFNSSNNVDIFNSNIEKVLSIEKAYINTNDGYIKLYSNTELQYLDLKGNKLDAKDILKNNVLFAKKQNGKWGFEDKSGKMVVNAQFDSVTEFNDAGYAGYRVGDKWGIINKDGQKVTEAIYTIDWLEPEFLGKYYKVYYGYGQPYYTDVVDSTANKDNNVVTENVSL